MSVDEEKELIVHLSEDEVNYLKKQASINGLSMDDFIEKIISNYLVE